ncbi:hypothetical protein RvY_11210 [Ramazzottius varieornatus]|uniref:Transposase Tc1-like domain-containing protein n=1 Tax=Ramazzottius varieornatus TaxID=947166 RepID=A0A1D1VFC8_RAMVA|nr:hypothetical protein RvY_11210 [Ramazzottius varieornatus]
MNFIRGPQMHPDIGTLQCSVCGPEFEVALPVTSKNQKKAENILDHIRSHTTLIAIQTQCCGEFLVPAIKQTYFQPRCPHVNTVQVSGLLMSISKETVRRRSREKGLNGRLALKKPFFKEHARQKRRLLQKVRGNASFFLGQRLMVEQIQVQLGNGWEGYGLEKAR